MSGTLFQIKRSTKLKYKLAIQQAFAQHENRYDDELATHFLNKRMPEFRKTWAKKFRKNANNDVFIDGTNDGQYVANAFASQFNKVYSSVADDCHSIKRPFMSAIEDHNDNATNISNDITVELVDKCIHRLHVGKASGPDDLSSEHLKYAHPLVVVQLCSLFRTMVIHGLVPDNFGNGIIIPLLKDKTGNVNSLDNYHTITLISVISKLFELVVVELCSEQFIADELQYGFKPNVGCVNAIFTLRTTIDYFTDRSSTVYGASLDISKGFDTVNHSKMFDALLKNFIPRVSIFVFFLFLK